MPENRGPQAIVTITEEQTSQLRWLQDHIHPRPEIHDIVEAAVARWIADQGEEVGIPGTHWTDRQPGPRSVP